MPPIKWTLATPLPRIHHNNGVISLLISVIQLLLIFQGSIVVGHTGFCHFDPNYWDQPEEFRPERFLNESGKLSVPKSAFMPFGTGEDHNV